MDGSTKKPLLDRKGNDSEGVAHAIPPHMYQDAQAYAPSAPPMDVGHDRREYHHASLNASAVPGGPDHPGPMLPSPAQAEAIPVAPVIAVPVAVPARPPVMVRWSRFPQHAVCPRCRQQVVSVTTYRAGAATLITCCVVAVVCAPFCCFAFCIPALKDVVHECPRCHTELGSAPVL
mmetsp:Transcript_27560/g.53551  ORF Transcript_27560/g.53551 Transcript_27560/m.53551 type:complete len:176 (+) Transcript_27560:29-556(+)